MNTPVILLADDEPELADVCREALSGITDRILVANDGMRAYDMLREGGVDLLLSDLRMPGMGGMELLSRIRSTGVDTDVIVLTGYGTLENAVECVKLGAVNYLLKPFRIGELLGAVDKALRERALRRQQKRVGNLSTMLRFSGVLSEQADLRSLVKEFLAQVREVFEPDGMVMFLTGETRRQVGQHVLVGPFFRKNEAARGWFGQFAASLLERGRPMLLDQALLRQALGPLAGTVAAPVSAISAVVGAGPASAGVVVAVRGEGRLPYTLDQLQLLTLFSAHTALCLESCRACQTLRAMNREMVHSFVSAVEAKDPYTRGHSERVSEFAALLGQALGLPKVETDLLRTAGMLHDIGKIGVPDLILNKPDSLEYGELVIMRQHAEIGRNILRNVSSLEDVLPAIFHHHEHLDGRGYPMGLVGSEIPLAARIISVADGYEAMTSNRAYHPARTPAEASDILRQGAGAQWDPQIVDAWLDVLKHKGVLSRSGPDPGTVFAT
ncbi:response regulator [Fundidesulfovibrio butyratiphilus]